MKVFNIFSVLGGTIGGVLAFMFGGFDVLLYALIVLVVLDYVTGLAKGFYTKTVSSEVGFKGLIKKFIIFVVVVVAVVLQRVLNNTVPLREVTITFFICNESISILENAAEFVPIPQKLKDVLLQLRSTGDKKTKEENDEIDEDAESGRESDG
jgi:toxin secretion/phage lysis holin